MADLVSEKSCTKCLQLNPPSGFYADARKRDGLQAQCKNCMRGAMRVHYGKNRDRVRAYQNGAYRATVDLADDRRRRLWSRYRMTPESYAALVDAQAGRCAICRVASDDLFVDHDHACCAQRSCGRCVRGLLCRPCNAALGLFIDDPERMDAAAKYVRERAA